MSQSDYIHMNDQLYALTDDVKLMFHTVASYNNGTKTFFNYNEYRINNRSDSNTVIKRSISYYLFLEDRRGGELNKIVIYPENMFELLQHLEHIKRNWIEQDAFNIYTVFNNTLTIINHDVGIYMRLPFDKVIRFVPGLIKTDMGDVKCIDLYLNSNEPIHVNNNNILGLYYLLMNLDMLNYANTALSFMMLLNGPVNRTDFSTTGKANSVQISDNSTASGSVGRSFNKKNSNKSSFFDDK